MELDFDLTGFDHYERALVRMLALLRDFRPFWPRLVPLFVEWMAERFGTEGAFGGEPWAPLSFAYLQRKQQLYPGKGILYATGQLRRHASMPRRIVRPLSVTFVIDDFDRKDGRRMEIEWFQRRTTTAPARPLIPLAWQRGMLPFHMQRQVEAEVDEYLEETARRVGLGGLGG